MKENEIREMLIDVFSQKIRNLNLGGQSDDIMLRNMNMPIPNVLFDTSPYVRLRYRFTDENGKKMEYKGEYETKGDSGIYYKGKFLGLYYGRSYKLSDEDKITIENIIDDFKKNKLIK